MTLPATSAPQFMPASKRAAQCAGAALHACMHGPAAGQKAPTIGAGAKGSSMHAQVQFCTLRRSMPKRLVPHGSLAGSISRVCHGRPWRCLPCVPQVSDRLVVSPMLLP